MNIRRTLVVDDPEKLSEIYDSMKALYDLCLQECKSRYQEAMKNPEYASIANGERYEGCMRVKKETEKNCGYTKKAIKDFATENENCGLTYSERASAGRCAFDNHEWLLKNPNYRFSHKLLIDGSSHYSSDGYITWHEMVFPIEQIEGHIMNMRMAITRTGVEAIFTIKD